MTATGRFVAVFSAASLVAGFLLSWPSLLVIGVTFALAVVYGFISTRSSQSIEIHRSLHPRKVMKRAASISMLSMRNKSVRASGRIQVVQSLGDREITALLPPLLSKQSAVKSVPIPTNRRGHFEVGPVIIRRMDPFGLFRREQAFGQPEELWVQPSIAPLRPMSTGMQRDIEGPTSDRAPVGNIAFHRIREYVAGDDPRLIHWKATARKSTGILELMIRHNVDTTQPSSLVLLDNQESRFDGEDFEEAVDIAASATRAAFLAGGDLQLLTTSGDETKIRRGTSRSDGPIQDFLTDVTFSTDCSLTETLHEVAISRGGTTLIIVTGLAQPDEVAQAASLKKRFARVILISLGGKKPTNPFPQLVLLHGASFAEVVSQWNSEFAL